jgi:hypothetical protein
MAKRFDQCNESCISIHTQNRAWLAWSRDLPSTKRDDVTFLRVGPSLAALAHVLGRWSNFKTGPCLERFSLCGALNDGNLASHFPFDGRPPARNWLIPGGDAMTRAERERTNNAALYFMSKTHECTERKLFFLLYLLDVCAFQKSGQRVTGLSYVAQKSGPTPYYLKGMLEDKHSALAQVVRRETVNTREHPRQIFIVDDPDAFSDDWFVPDHLDLMAELARRLCDLRSRDIDVSKYDNGAFTRARDRGSEEFIRFEETVSEQDPHRAELLSIAAEARARRGYMQQAA